MPRAPVHVDYVQEIRSINVLPRFSIDHGGRVDHINEYLDRLIRRMCYELRGTKDSHYDVSQSWIQMECGLHCEDLIGNWLAAGWG